jgi:hypothetical protein
MKLKSSQAWYIPGNVALASILTVAAFFAITVFARARQTPPGPDSTTLNSAKKDFTEEWVYRVQYGHKDEWFRIFKKYQLAILERQKQLGFVKQYTVWAPGLHTSEESRWDYRVIIVRTSYDAPPGQSEDEIAKQLFPDQAAFKQEENRRWELTANHWDLPIHVVDPNAAE